jgi:diacylglycerol kinase (ATP)
LHHPDSRLAADLRHVVVSVNPKAGAVSANPRVARLVEQLRQAELDVSVLSNLEEVSALANRLFLEHRLRALIGVGGDGTAAELVNRTLPGLPLALFPSGNENLLARYFGIGPTPEECARTVIEGAVTQCDAAQAAGRIFLLMFSCGFDAEVVHSLHLHRTGHVTSASYFSPIMASIRHYDYPELRVYWNHADGAESTVAPSLEAEQRALAAVGDARWLFAFNLPCYGAGLQIAPEADGTDGLLDVCTFRRGGLWNGLYYTAAVLTGVHHWLADFAHRRVTRFRVTSEAKVPYQLDGDPGGFLPVEVDVLPKRLALVVPREKAVS